MNNIARVFPRRTKATPTDAFAFFDAPPMFLPEISEVHISVAFTWDIQKAEWLGKQWSAIRAPQYGGPAFGKPSGSFVSGMYLKEGYTITSRGCPNRCWFCSVWKREPKLKELNIMDGWNVLDDNLLACSESHVRAVFDMLKRQKHRVSFTGGLEAKLLKPWHIDLMQGLRIDQMFFAYDTPDDYEPLLYAAKMLREAGYKRQTLRCYVLMGWKGDTIDKAEIRLRQVIAMGIFPMAMLYRDKDGQRDYVWQKFAREWARPAIIAGKLYG